jgi:hypothetical protein
MTGKRHRAIRPKQIGVKLTLPFVGEISGTWEPDDAESQAAWELYIELITRVSVVELRPGTGLVREALSSLYTLFETTRTILRKYGPALAPRARQDEITFGHLAIGVLHGALRPLLTKWHPELQDWEAARDPETGRTTHEQAWEHFAELHAELAATRATLAELAKLLADVAGVAYLVPELPPLDQPKKPRGGGEHLRRPVRTSPVRPRTVRARPVRARPDSARPGGVRSRTRSAAARA